MVITNGWGLWLGITFIILIAELLTGSGFLLWIAASAGLTCLLVFLIPPMTIFAQAGFFSICAITSWVLWWYYRKQTHQVSPAAPLLNRRAEQTIGRVVTLTEPIINGQGRVHIDDSFWRVEGEDLPQGTLVKIVAIDGIILKVVKAE
jgi:membrane protein implicated in regulation of membrane protease activity